MGLALRQGERRGLIDRDTQAALMEMVPEPPRGAVLSVEASMVLSVYNRCGGCPVSMGMGGTVDRRAEVTLPRLDMARRAHPAVAPEFFEGLFAWLDDYYVREMRRRAEAAAEESKRRANG